MAMVLDLLAGKTVRKLAEIAEQGVCKVLGVKEEIEKLQRRLMRISSFLQDAERKMHTDAAIRTWVKEIKDIMYDADDIIDDCMFDGGKLLELQQHPSSSPIRFLLSLLSSCFSCFQYRHEIANRIEKLNDRLKEIAEDNKLLQLKLVESSNQGSPGGSGVSSRATSSTQVDLEIVGTRIEDAANDIIKWILEDDRKQYQVYGIVGMGGIGKTTLARKIYKDERVKAKFDKQIWLYISKNYDEIKLFKELIRGIKGNVGEAESIEELDDKFVNTLRSKHKKIFLVLDDLWSANLWNNRLKTSIQSSRVISKILITSRDANVGRAMRATDDHIHHVEKLDREDGWELLKKIVFIDGDKEMMPMLKDVGIKILDKCDGLPLAITVIAGILLRKERTQREWEKVFKSDVWKMNQIDDEIPRALYLSYEDLPSYLKTCFLSCVLFKGSIDVFRLVRFWMAEGFIAEQEGVFMEESGEGNCRELVSRNLLQSHPNSSSVMDDFDSEGESSFVMHDLLRALATNLTEGEIMLSEGEASKSNNLLTKIRRLSISNQGHPLTLSSIIIEQNCLRVLLVQNCFKCRIENDTLKILRRLRVLDLSGTTINSIPDSIGELLHLKCLYLNSTDIRELPESVGDLTNLQTLSMKNCRSLHRLPNSITRLCDLRCLCFESRYNWHQDAPLTYIPKGIGRLTNINHLDGFRVGCDDSANSVGCDLEDLQSLSNLRFLRMHGLGRASSREGATVLQGKSYLKCLFIDWNTRNYRCIDSNTTSDEAETIKIRAESVCSQLSPSPSHLEHLGIYNFPGRRFPDWIMSTSLVDSFRCLAYIKISDIQFCTELPPLGQLLQLKDLRIYRAHGIKKIGPEFLGCRGSSGFAAFPKLDYLEFNEMPNWEEWELYAEQEEEEVGDQRNHLELFPNLTKCLFMSCMSLIALPEAFYHATNLKYLQVLFCDSLKRISSLPPLKSLSIEFCPSLEHVETDDLPQALHTTCPTGTGLLPEWLLDLLMKCNHQSQHSLEDFQMLCDRSLVMNCLKGKPYWHIIEQIPKVYITDDDYIYEMQYTKNPPYYDTTVTDSDSE